MAATLLSVFLLTFAICSRQAARLSDAPRGSGVKQERRGELGPAAESRTLRLRLSGVGDLGLRAYLQGWLCDL